MGDITLLTYAMGLSSILVVLTGLVTAILLLIRYSRTRNPAVLGVMFLILSMGLTWIGTSISFFLVLAGEDPLGADAYALLTLTPLSFIGPLLVLTTMQMLNFKKKMSVVLAIMIIFAGACLFAAYTQTEDVYEEYKIHEESGLGEGSYAGVVQYTIAVYILFTLLFMTPLYIFVCTKTESSQIRMKTGLLALGYGFFGFFAIFDGLFT
ncbi:MAG: hypothetical protein ACFFB3_21595, partial [Candidatus Hodarchaeota archaeon]